MIDEKKLIKDIKNHKELHWEYDETDNDWTGQPVLDFQSIEETINSQPKVGEWIPRSERLPEKYVTVLVQWEKRYMSENLIETYLDIGLINEDGEWISANGYGIYNGQVIAWMTLPEPWGGVEDEIYTNK